MAALTVALAVFESTDLDLHLQDLLFDSAKRAWLVDGNDLLWRALFYTGPKLVLIALGIATFFVALATRHHREQLGRAAIERRSLLTLGLTLATTPALVGGLKSTTNVFCPSEIQRYGGDICYVKIFERYSATNRPPRRGRCLPAGHASGGFALVALAGIARQRSEQLLALGLAATVGGVMGFHQMAKGSHYLSHTVVTALLAWLVFLGWRAGLGRIRSQWLSRP